MKTLTITIMTLVGLLSFNACKKDSSKSLCENLASQGTANLSALVGDWEFERFAYTPNGSRIQNETDIEKGYISVTDTGSIWFYHTNSIHYLFDTENSNRINLLQGSSTKINPPQEEIDVSDAFNNAKCYVIKGNELFIHYREKDKKNILILEKK